MDPLPFGNSSASAATSIFGIGVQIGPNEMAFVLLVLLGIVGFYLIIWALKHA